MPARPRMYFAIIACAFVASRVFYRLLGVRFDAKPLEFYWQFIDPSLLRHDFWRSILYLEQQPPAFNIFLGAVLHLAPKHPVAAFHFAYLCVGLALALSLFALMTRINADPRVALGITLVFTLSPSTVLYENLLFYEHPIAALLCIGALFLHRYASAGRISDGLVFFSSLALLAGIRAIYHLAWFAVIAVFAGLALRQWRRQTMLAAAVPTLLLVSFYAKHFVLFRNLMPGGTIYGGINLSIMTTWALPPGALDRLIASGKISVLKTDIFQFVGDVRTDVGDSPLARIVPVPPKTGIAVRDACLKSTRRFNWNCVWAASVSKLYTRDSLLVLRAFPNAYLRSVWANVLQYFMPDTERWPRDGRTQDANEQVLSRPLAVYDLVTSGRWPGAGNQPWLFYVTLPGLVGMGVFKLVCGRRQIHHDPALLTLAFMVFNIVYLTVVVVVFSESDQNRYRTELSPFFAVLLGMLATSVMKSRNRAASTARTEWPVDGASRLPGRPGTITS